MISSVVGIYYRSYRSRSECKLKTLYLCHKCQYHFFSVTTHITSLWLGISGISLWEFGLQAFAQNYFTCWLPRAIGKMPEIFGTLAIVPHQNLSLLYVLARQHVTEPLTIRKNVLHFLSIYAHDQIPSNCIWSAKYINSNTRNCTIVLI